MPLPNKAQVPLSRESKGSRLRCLQLTSLPKESVANFLQQLVTPHAQVSADTCWMPRGPLAPREALIGRSEEFLTADQRNDLIRWWLEIKLETSKIPNWDLAASCTVQGHPGLILVEAKAHHAELNEQDASGAAGANRAKIEKALKEAEHELNQLVPGWTLQADRHYQLSNRFAWAWKVASLGVPVVLVYLGFLNATEMATGSRKIFQTPEEWDAQVRRHSGKTVPPTIWNKPLFLKNGTPLIPLIHAAEVTIEARVIASNV